MFSTLQLDVLTFVFSFLRKRKDLEEASVVCKYWNKASKHPSLNRLWNLPENWQRANLIYWAVDLEHKKNLKAEENKLLKEWKKYNLKDIQKMKKLVYKGIPKELRGQVWYTLSGAEFYRKNTTKTYQDFVESCSESNKQMISRDITRTSLVDLDRIGFTNESLRGLREQVERVCLAASTYFPSGYTSGVSFLVSPLLLFMSEEEAFWTFIAMIKMERGSIVNMEDIIMWRRLEQVIHIWDKLLLLKSPVAHSLNMHGVSSSMYLFVLFPLWFSYQLPVDILVRLWDVIFFEGTDALFFMGMNYMKELHKLNPRNFEEWIPITVRNVASLYADRKKFIERMLDINIDHAILKKLSD